VLVHVLEELGLWCLMPFQQYFSYIVVVSFIGGGNQSTRRKPLICHKSLINLYYMKLYQVNVKPTLNIYSQILAVV